KKEDFYDSSIQRDWIKFDLKVVIIDVENKAIINEEVFNIEMVANNEQQNISTKARALMRRKFTNLLNHSAYLQPFYAVEKVGKVFIRLKGGYVDGIKRGDFYIAYHTDSANSRKKTTLIQIIKVDFDYSLGLILQDQIRDKLVEENSEVPIHFQKLRKIDLDIQILGTVGLSFDAITEIDQDYPVNVYPYLGIRAQFPVTVVFFKPVIEFDLYFAYQSSNLLIPFLFSTGFQAEFNIRRLGIHTGFLIGAFFSPDSELDYRVDTFSLMPFIRFSAHIQQNFNAFGEIGYRYIHNSKFEEDWNIDLSGLTLSIGLGIIL
ncbi:MAG: hypothetical protein MJB14_03060, partial [Spirochaetes bacterium]|nr:hypothetical protein [Spirochaetota bacterium]